MVLDTCAEQRLERADDDIRVGVGPPGVLSLRSRARVPSLVIAAVRSSARRPRCAAAHLRQAAPFRLCLDGHRTLLHLPGKGPSSAAGRREPLAVRARTGVLAAPGAGRQGWTCPIDGV